jgi:hypothetical protein
MRSNAPKVVLAAFLLLLARLLVIGIFGPTSPPRYADTAVYYDVSRNLSTSQAAWVRPGSEFGYRAPAYFAYLAAVFALIPGSTYRSAQSATSMLGVLTCVLVFLVLRRTESEKAGMVAFWVRGLCLSFVFADTFVMSEPLFSALQMAAILVFVLSPPSPGWRYTVPLGILVGLCVLTRESASGYPLIFAGGLFLLGGPVTKKAVRVCLFILAVTLPLLPWLWRNQIVWGSPLPLSLTSGANLYIGNNPTTIGRWQEVPGKPPPEIRPGTHEANDWYRRQAVQYITSHPDRFLTNGFKKIAWFLFPSFNRDPITHIFSGSPRLLLVLSLLSGGMSALLILAGVAGLILAKPGRFWWLSATMIAYYLGLTYVAFGHPRLRDPVDNILVCYVATLLANWPQVRSQLQWRVPMARYRMCALGLVYAFILTNWMVIALGKI